MQTCWFELLQMQAKMFDGLELRSWLKSFPSESSNHKHCILKLIMNMLKKKGISVLNKLLICKWYVEKEKK